MEHESVSSLRQMVSILAIMAAAAAIANVIFLFVAIRLYKELHGFFAEIQQQIQSYLATHNLWSDVGHKLISTGPQLLEGGIRFTSSLQQLAQYVEHAGGLGRILETSAKARAKTKEDAKPPSRARGSATSAEEK